MNNLDIDIQDLSIINEFASDTQDFIFDNKHRAWDGFVYFTDGIGTFADSDGRTFEIKKSTLVLLRAGESYSFNVKAGYRYVTSAYKIIGCENSTNLLPKVVQCSERESLILENVYKMWRQRKPYSRLSCKIQSLELYLELFKTFSLNLAFFNAPFSQVSASIIALFSNLLFLLCAIFNLSSASDLIISFVFLFLSKLIDCFIIPLSLSKSLTTILFLCIYNFFMSFLFSIIS